jgi:putative hydrolase of the HAD superfamily
VYRLYLYTAGDRAIQQAKINELHVQRYFDAVWLTDRKSTPDLQCHLHAHAIDPAISWSVGNSPRSDINVGVGVGLRCIWVQNTSWEFEQEPVLPGAVWTAATLDDVLSIVMRIDHVSV